MKNLRHFITVLFYLLAAITIQARENQNVKKIGDRIFRISIEGINCVVLIDDSGNVLLSDNFKEIQFGKLMDALKSINGKTIQFMINTHHHEDHCGGNKTIKCPAIIAHENIIKALSVDHISEFWKDTSKAFPASAFPNLYIKESLTLNFAGEEIEITHFPGGHTYDDLVVYFKKAKIVHLSDLLFSIGFPAVDFERGGSVRRLTDNLEKILNTYPDNAVFVAGHGEEYTKDELREYWKMLLGTTEVIKKEMVNGAKLDEIKKKNILAEWKKWGNGYFSCDDWMGIIYESLSKDDLENNN